MLKENNDGTKLCVFSACSCITKTMDVDELLIFLFYVYFCGMKLSYLLTFASPFKGLMSNAAASDKHRPSFLH